jgi:hypothetical protein
MSIKHEFEKGFSWPYFIVGGIKKFFTFNKYAVPEYGLGGRLFSITAERVKNKSNEDAEKILEDAVYEYGRRRGKETASTVIAKGKDLSLRNMLIYNDLADKNFKISISIKDGDLIIKVKKCNFYYYSKEWNVDDGAHPYCECEDGAFKDGYNPSIKIFVEPCYKSKKDYCTIHYKVKGEITEPTV